jgi:hypothetical protein
LGTFRARELEELQLSQHLIQGGGCLMESNFQVAIAHCYGRPAEHAGEGPPRPLDDQLRIQAIERGTRSLILSRILTTNDDHVPPLPKMPKAG